MRATLPAGTSAGNGRTEKGWVHMAEFLPELLAPAGGMEQLEAALMYGADAVYLGGRELSLRAQCAGFDGEALAGAIRLAHAAGARVYYCLNAFPYDRQLHDVHALLEHLPELGVDGLIAADPGVIWLASRLCPSVELHLSTQAHSVNAAAVEFWRAQGLRRINLARELPLPAIRALIRAFPEMEFELFVHGAMCLALSGHCLLSAWANNRPANQGRCTQPCRFDYRARAVRGGRAGAALPVPHNDQRWTRHPEARGMLLSMEEALRTGKPFWDVREGEDFSGIWAPQDICLVRYMDWLARSGAASLKLEGRTKSGGYVGQVVDVYRAALDRAGLRHGLVRRSAAGPANGCAGAAEQRSGTQADRPLSPADCVAELLHTASRPLSTGFFFPRRKVESVPEDFIPRPVVARLLAPAEGPLAVSADEAHHATFHPGAGLAAPCGGWHVQVRAEWTADRDVSILLPGMRRPVLRAGSYVLENHRGEKTDRLHPGTTGILRGTLPPLAYGLYLRA